MQIMDKGESVVKAVELRVVAGAVVVVQGG